MGLLTVACLLEKAQRDGYAVGSFNVFNLETLIGVVRAAEEAQSPVIAAISPRHFTHVRFETFVPLAREIAQETSIPMALHLDHAQDIDTIVRAIRCGFTSVMYDGLGLGYGDKVQQTRLVSGIAHAVGVTVEAELGHVGRAGIQHAEELTDPEAAPDFVRRTQVDSLAVAIGSTHGMKTTGAELDLKRLVAIKRGVGGTFLTLHGGSGLSDEEFRRGIENGICKISVFTRVARSAGERLGSRMAQDPGAHLLSLMQDVVDAVKETVRDRISVFGSAGRRREGTTRSRTS